ncbi:hypothetical protein FRUB_02373 [Fimbriiglobus ruber]|uniref:Uncharacterized protein n=1 Tax=Fimbriiglobus ruber TaxID=1908690 RepID=A0A225DSY9_9BACT|nr:hypothetical protein FRUB_02373 [Fimbriiglobus ruber]
MMSDEHTDGRAGGTEDSFSGAEEVAGRLTRPHRTGTSTG